MLLYLITINPQRTLFVPNHFLVLMLIRGSQLWNILPNDLMETASFESCKKLLKLFLHCDPL